MNKFFTLILLFNIQVLVAQDIDVDGDWMLNKYKTFDWITDWGDYDWKIFQFHNDSLIRKAIPSNDFTDTVLFKLSGDSIYINNNLYALNIEISNNLFEFEVDSFAIYTFSKLNKTAFKQEEYLKVLNLITENKITINGLGDNYDKSRIVKFILDKSLKISPNYTIDKQIAISNPIDKDENWENYKGNWGLELHDGYLFLKLDNTTLQINSINEKIITAHSFHFKNYKKLNHKIIIN